VGLVIGFGDLASGSGSDAVLKRASMVIFSSGEGLFISTAGGRAVDPDEVDLDDSRRGAFPDDLGADFTDGLAAGDRGGATPAWFLDSGALAMRPSFGRLDLPLLAPTVCDREGARFLAGVEFEFEFVVVSAMLSTTGRGFLACATASGPAQCVKAGQAMLARTKLPRTVTGRAFSVIFSCPAASATPKTTCCTLL